MKDKEGNYLTVKEFFSRWKSGIQNVTAYQLSIITLMGTVLVLIGVCIGLFITFKARVWWLFIILLGSLFITSTSLIAGYQKYSVLKSIAKLKGGLDE